LLKVLTIYIYTQANIIIKEFIKATGGHWPGVSKPPAAPKGGSAKATWYSKQRVGGRAYKTLTR